MNPLPSSRSPMTPTEHGGTVNIHRLCMGGLTAALMVVGGCGGGGGDETPNGAFDTRQLAVAKKQPDATPDPVAQYPVVTTHTASVPAVLAIDERTVAPGRLPEAKKRPDVSDARSALNAQAVTVVNTTTAGDQEVRAIGALSFGGYAVAWRSGQGLYLQRYDSAGNRMGTDTAIQLRVDPQDGLTHRLETAMAVLSDGTSLVAYVVRRAPGDFVEVELLVERFDQTGAQILPATRIDLVTSAARRSTSIGAVRILPRSDGGYVVSWGTFYVSATVGSRNHWSAQRFDSANQPVGARTGLNAASTVDTFCRINADANDGYVTYCSGTREQDGSPNGLAVTHFDSNGSMTQVLAGWPGSAVLLPLLDGRYVLYAGDAAGSYSQFLDSTGAPSGQRTAVVSVPTYAQSLVDGTYVVFRFDGGGATAQRFTIDGEPMGGAFTLTTAGAQPLLEPLGEGGFAAAWSAAAPSGDLDVYTQRFIEVGPGPRKRCLASAKARGLRGHERQAFMASCLG